MSDKPAETSTTTTTTTPSTTTTTTDNPFAAPIHNPFAAFSSSAPDQNNIFNFNPLAAGSNQTNTNNTDESGSKEEGGDDNTVSGADSTAHYEPVVKLAEVETTTGEENDEELYKQRSALYRFDGSSNEWKERGRGDVKLLKNKNSGKIRILLRQEKTLKCCMNHLVLPDVDLKANAGSDRSWTWRCIDYAGDEPEAQTFAIRFKDADTAQAFKNKIDECRKVNKELEGKTAAEGKKAE